MVEFPSCIFLIWHEGKSSWSLSNWGYFSIRMSSPSQFRIVQSLISAKCLMLSTLLRSQSIFGMWRKCSNWLIDSLCPWSLFISIFILLLFFQLTRKCEVFLNDGYKHNFTEIQLLIMADKYNLFLTRTVSLLFIELAIWPQAQLTDPKEIVFFQTSFRMFWRSWFRPLFFDRRSSKQKDMVLFPMKWRELLTPGLLHFCHFQNLISPMVFRYVELDVQEKP